MKLKVNTKALIASTVALAVIPFTKATAETLEDWVARSVDEIKHDIQQSGDNQQTYTIKYGDTLSSIAEALGIDVHVLANLNNISNMDLIYPGTVLKTTVNDQKEVTSVEIQTPQAGATDATTASADLTTNPSSTCCSRNTELRCSSYQCCNSKPRSSSRPSICSSLRSSCRNTSHGSSSCPSICSNNGRSSNTTCSNRNCCCP